MGSGLGGELGGCRLCVGLFICGGRLPRCAVAMLAMGSAAGSFIVEFERAYFSCFAELMKKSWAPAHTSVAALQGGHAWWATWTACWSLA